MELRYRFNKRFFIMTMIPTFSTIFLVVMKSYLFAALVGLVALMFIFAFTTMMISYFSKDVRIRLTEDTFTMKFKIMIDIKMSDIVGVEKIYDTKGKINTIVVRYTYKEAEYKETILDLYDHSIEELYTTFTKYINQDVV